MLKGALHIFLRQTVGAKTRYTRFLTSFMVRLAATHKILAPDPASLPLMPQLEVTQVMFTQEYAN